MSVYKFVKHDIKPLDTYKDSKPYILHDKLEAGIEPDKDEKRRLAGEGFTQVMGYTYDYRPFLKCFWAEIPYYGVQQYYAYDKESLLVRLEEDYNNDDDDERDWFSADYNRVVEVENRYEGIE